MCVSTQQIISKNQIAIISSKLPLMCFDGFNQQQVLIPLVHLKV